MNTSKKIAVVCTAILITSFAFFQNCTQTKFGSDTSTTSASSVDPTANSPTENNPISNPPVDESTNAVRKISVCQSQSCVETAEQRVFFTNQIGVSLKVKEVSRLSEKDVVVNVQNYLNGNPGRHMNVRLTLAKNGYVFARFVDGEKRHLCLDHTKAEDA